MDGMNSGQVSGLDPEKDCLPGSLETGSGEAKNEIDFDHVEKTTTEIWLPKRNALMHGLERILLLAEKPVTRLVGAPQLNPFYYTGPIAVFLFGVISVTGLFLVMFFQVGFDSSYLFISRVETQPIARLVRAAHRYASDAFVIVSLIHAFRLFVMNRFRGPRWIAWVSGILMILPVWLAGVTGYWMMWDERALAITQSFDHILQRGAYSVMNLLATNQKGNSWIFIMILLVAHLLLTIIIGVAIWAHVARLNRPKWLPSRYWMMGLTIVVLVVSAVLPLGMLPKADLAATTASAPFSIDVLYLFYVPLAFNSVTNSPWLWIGLFLVLGMIALFPWLSLRKETTPSLVVDKAKCNGCTLCAVDCPYKAITMEPRTDGRPHKFVAVEHSDLCVSCGICIGSCDSNAISLGAVSSTTIWNAVNARRHHAPNAEIVFTCERHAANGARNVQNNDKVQVIPLPCVGMIYPDLIGKIRESGAPSVRVVGCPPEDCANREGNGWVEGRLTRTRMPRLRKKFGDEPVATRWLAPDEFIAALKNREQDASMVRKLTWRHFIPAFVFLIVVLLVQILVTTPLFTP